MTDITELALIKGQKVEAPYYLAECTECGKMYSSSKLIESRNYFDGDADCYCPYCNADDADIADLGSGEQPAVMAWNYQQARIDALVEALETEKRICATWRKTAESTSEKLEKAQAAERRWHRVASRVHEQACESDVKIDELEAIRAAAEKLVRCKGRYHSEQNYRALAALFGVNTPDLPPLDGEPRAVTVENLQESAYRAGLTAGWNLGLANNNDGFNKCLAAHAAGIKVEAE